MSVCLYMERKLVSGFLLFAVLLITMQMTLAGFLFQQLPGKKRRALSLSLLYFARPIFFAQCHSWKVAHFTSGFGEILKVSCKRISYHLGTANKKQNLLIMFSLLERKQNENLFRGKVSAMLIQLHNRTVTASGLMFPKAWRLEEDWASEPVMALKRNSPLGNFQFLDYFRVIPDVLRGGI